MSDSLERLRAVKARHEAEWLALPGVLAVGIGLDAGGAPQLVVSVEAESERIRRAVPAQIEGVPVEIRVTGPLRAL